MKFRLVAAILSLALFSTTSNADTPAGGIGGLAISPDGTTVMAAGDSRAVYVLDAATMQVKNRVYTGTTIVWMTYRIDGQVIFLRDTSGRLQAVDANSFKELWSIDKTETVDYALAANTLAVTLRENRTYVAKTIDAATFQTKGTWELGEKFYPVAQGISIDGLKTVILSRSEKRESEDKQRPTSDMKGLTRALFQQEHDQRGAKIVQIDLASGQMTTTESWYKSDNVRGMKVSLAGSFVLSFSAEMARITPSGEVEIIDSGARNHYGATMTPTMDTIISGSLKQITIKPLAADAAQVFKLKSLPGWPEYVIRFAQSSDGRIMAATTGYRIVVLDPASGKVDTYPIY